MQRREKKDETTEYSDCGGGGEAIALCTKSPSYGWIVTDGLAQVEYGAVMEPSPRMLHEGYLGGIRNAAIQRVQGTVGQRENGSASDSTVTRGGCSER